MKVKIRTEDFENERFVNLNDLLDFLVISDGKSGDFYEIIMNLKALNVDDLC